MKILFINPVNRDSIYFANPVARFPYLGTYHLARLTPDAVSKRLSKTRFCTAFMMAGTYFANYMFTTFSETGYWDTIRGELEQNDLSMPTVRQAATI